MELQAASQEIWEMKYQLKTKQDVVIDETVQASFERVALELAEVEDKSVQEEWYKKFLWALQHGAVPAGRIMSNLGASYYKPSTSSINCLSGNTKVLTREYGVVRISFLAGKEVHVVNGKGRWSKVKFRSYGIQTTYPMSFSRLNTSRCNEVIRSTGSHRWVLQDGRVATTEFFLSGPSLRKLNRFPNLVAPKQKLEKDEYLAGILHGLVFGDGCARPTEGDSVYQLDLINEKRELAPLVKKILKVLNIRYSAITVKYGDTSEGLRFGHLHSDTDLKSLPEKSLASNYSYLRGFFAGILAADGSIDLNGSTASDVLIYGTKDLIQFLNKYLPIAGLLPTKYSRFSKKGTKTNLGTRTRDLYVIHIHTYSVIGKDVLRELHKSKFVTDGDLCGLSFSTWKLTGCDYDPVEEEVFCCVEPETHSFVLGSGLLTGNCTVSGTIQDSMDDILSKVHEAGMTLKAGCGIGYEFSTLRPRDAFVAGAGAYTSGPLSFMNIYDKMCFTVASAGGRRGAQMSTFSITHPDVLEYIKAKREDGRLRQFNLSLLITKEFIEAVNENAYWQLSFPITQKELDLEGFQLHDQNIIWRDHPITEGYIVNEAGQVAQRVYSIVEARVLWDAIMSSTYDFAEPGFILIDKVNEMNNLWFCENIRATNPCGEQPLPPYGSCLLGSINLTNFVTYPFTDKASFDFNTYTEVISIFTRMLDNVVELNGLPLSNQRDEILRKRRHGMGFFGLGSALAMLKIAYGSPASLAFTDEVSKTLALKGWETGVALAKEKGPAPIFQEDFIVTQAMLAKCPALNNDGYFIGDTIPAKLLFSTYGNYMKRIAEASPSLVEEIKTYGCRFTHHSSIAPTGTISLSFGNNASNGIEPSFSHSYTRNVIKAGRKTKDTMAVYSYELLVYRHLIDPDANPGDGSLPDYFVSADTISPKAHVDVQAAAQKWIDSSISKTINVPTDFPYEDFKDIYMYAYEQGLKGCTTFRFNPEAFQGVLVNASDLENTTYEFVLEDGHVVECKGNDSISYEGETHTAANLYDALKENYYGKL
jgi:ribonucleoside-diphosphate reductase alpha chain